MADAEGTTYTMDVRCDCGAMVTVQHVRLPRDAGRRVIDVICLGCGRRKQVAFSYCYQGARDEVVIYGFETREFLGILKDGRFTGVSEMQ